MPPADGYREYPLEDFRDRLRDRARRTFDRRLQGFADVSDLVQITIEKAQSRHQQFRGKSEGSLLAWLYRTLDRVVLDKLRKLKRQGGNPQSLGQLPDDSSAGPRIEPQSDETSPSRKYVKSEEISRMLAAIEELPESQRTAVRLRYIEELDVSEVARRMGKTSSAVMSLLFRGMKALREKLGRDSIDGER